MSWSTGFSKYLRQKEDAEKAIDFVKGIGIAIGDTVLRDGKVDKVKEIWLETSYRDNKHTFNFRIELVSSEDYMYDISEITYGPGVKILYAKD